MESRSSLQGRTETRPSEEGNDPAQAARRIAGKAPGVAPLARSRYILPALVLAVTFLVYSGTLRYGFVYDDQGQVVRNLFIQSWLYVPRYFTSHVWSYLFPGNVANYYRPLFLLWLRVNDAVFGLQPAGWHLTSVLAHLLVTLEVYWLGVRLLEDRGSATVAAALFGLHPIHVESVAWVSGVTDPMVAALMLASFLSYLRSRDLGRKKVVWWLASLVLYGLALLSKETALIYPALIFIFAWIWWREPSPGGRRGQAVRLRDSLLQTAPYLAVTAAYLPLRIHALGGFSHALTPVPLAASILTWPSLIWFYGGKLLWPARLSPFYDLEYITRLGLREVFLPLAGIAAIIAPLWVWSRRGATSESSWEDRNESRALRLALAWLCLPIVPLLDLSVFGSGDIAHDRYLYIPSIGAAWIAAIGWKRLSSGGPVQQVGAQGPASGDPENRNPASLRWQWVGALGTSVRKSLAVPLAVALALSVVLAGLTVADSAYWSNNLSLYSRGVSLAPNNLRARLDLANAACDRGHYDDGLKLYAQVIERAPNFPLAFYDRGVTGLELGRLGEADRDLTRAIELDGGNPSAFYSLGLVRFREGRLEESARLLRRALELQPEAVGYRLALGRVLEGLGDIRGALEEFRAEYAAHSQLIEARQEMLRLEKTAPPQAPPSRPSAH